MRFVTTTWTPSFFVELVCQRRDFLVRRFTGLSKRWLKITIYLNRSFLGFHVSFESALFGVVAVFLINYSCSSCLEKNDKTILRVLLHSLLYYTSPGPVVPAMPVTTARRRHRERCRRSQNKPISVMYRRMANRVMEPPGDCRTRTGMKRLMHTGTSPTHLCK